MHEAGCRGWLGLEEVVHHSSRDSFEQVVMQRLDREEDVVHERSWRSLEQVVVQACACRKLRLERRKRGRGRGRVLGYKRCHYACYAHSSSRWTHHPSSPNYIFDIPSLTEFSFYKEASKTRQLFKGNKQRILR